MKKLFLLIIVITTQKHASELVDLIQAEPFHVSSYVPGSKVIPFTAQKSNNGVITVTQSSEENMSEAIAVIIIKAQAVAQNLGSCTLQEVRQIKSACLRELKKSTNNSYEREQLAKAYAELN